MVFKCRGPKKYTPIYRSETRRATGGAITWNEVMLGTTDLCNDNVENEIKFEFFRNESSGTHVNLGVFSTTLAVLKTPCPPG